MNPPPRPIPSSTGDLEADLVRVEDLLRRYVEAMRLGAIGSGGVERLGEIGRELHRLNREITRAKR